MSSEIKLNTKGLDSFLKALKGPMPIAKVGILGSKTERENKKPGELNNATIGLAHEFGTDKLPVRSFLRVPLTLKLDKALKDAGAFTPAAFKKVIASGSLVEWTEKLGATGVSVVLEGFDTAGFGTWKKSDMRYKKVQQTLVETQQLRNSIFYEVSER